MAIPVSVDDINAFTNRFLVRKSTDVVYKESPLFTRMLSKQRVSFPGGTSITRPIMYAELNGGFFSKGDTFNTAYVKTDAAFNVNAKFAHVNVSLYRTDNVLNRGREAAFSVVETKMANASMKMAKILSQAFYQDGQTSAADVVTSAGVLSTTTSLDGLLAWVDDGNSNSTTYSAATDITKSFLTVGGLTRSDLFTSAPTFTGSSTPLAAIGGANAYCERAFSSFSLQTINLAYGNAWFGNRYVDLILCQQAGWNKFWGAMQPNQRFMDDAGDLAKIGFRSFRFNSANVVVDKYMPNNLMLGLNTDYVEMFVSDDPAFQMGFTGFKEGQNTIDLAGQFLFAGNLIVPNARTCFKIVGTALA